MAFTRAVERFRFISCCLTAVMAVTAGCSPKDQKSSNHPSADGPKAETGSASADSATWQLTDASNALDGQAFKVAKTFVAPDTNSRFDVEITCAVKLKDLKIQISSYENTVNKAGGYDGAPLALLDSGKPAGRAKFGSEDPQALSLSFALAQYRNVIVWDLDNTEYLDLNTKKSYPTPGAYFQSILPLEIELQNDGGIARFEIPADSDAVNTVVGKCAAPVTTSTNDQSADSPSAPVPDPSQQQAPSEPTDRQNGSSEVVR